MKKEQLIYFQIVVLLSLDKLSFFIKNALNYRSHVPQSVLFFSTSEHLNEAPDLESLWEE